MQKEKKSQGSAFSSPQKFPSSGLGSNKFGSLPLDSLGIDSRHSLEISRNGFENAGMTLFLQGGNRKSEW